MLPIAIALLAALPARADFLAELESLGLGLRADIAASRVVRLRSGPVGHDAVLSLVLERLAGAAVTEAEVRAAFQDPRLRLIPEIPGKFRRPKVKADYDEARGRVLTEARIQAGVDFVLERRDLLGAVEGRYGVDALALAGLSGIETFYGRNAGSYPVFSALYTIARLMPERSSWAVRELAELLVLAKAEALDSHALKGSYAGAFGFVQFLPSSFNRRAVDFDGDGLRRLDSWPDALGSAANYLQAAGWEPGGPLTPGSRNWKAVRAYNHSDTYVRLVLDLRQAILDRLPAPGA